MSRCPYCNVHLRSVREKEIHRCFVGQVVSPSLSEDGDIRDLTGSSSTPNQTKSSNSQVQQSSHDTRRRGNQSQSFKSSETSMVTAALNESQSASSDLNSRSSLQCQICRKFYATKASLSKHVRSIHHGERYLCLVPECRQEFRSSSARKTHLERSHSWVGSTGAPGRAMTRASRPFKCIACGASFTARRELTRHTNKAHKTTATSDRL